MSHLYPVRLRQAAAAGVSAVAPRAPDRKKSGSNQSLIQTATAGRTRYEVKLLADTRARARALVTRGVLSINALTCVLGGADVDRL